MFFTSRVFLKSLKRIVALGLLMALCLLVYNLGQRQLRQTLAQQAQTLPIKKFRVVFFGVHKTMWNNGKGKNLKSLVYKT